MSNYEFWDELGKIFNAVVAYQEKTIEFNKRFINPWIRLGNVFDKQDRNKEAVSAYEKAIEIDPDNAQNWHELGNVQFKMGHYEEAIAAFNKSIELDPGFGWSYCNLALALVSQGKHTQAIPLYRKSIELLVEEKDRAVAWNRLGNVYRKLNEYALAVEAFQKADELDHENAGFRDNLDESPEAPVVVEADGAESVAEGTPVTVSPIQLIVADGQAEEAASPASEPDASVQASTEIPTQPAVLSAQADPERVVTFDANSAGPIEEPAPDSTAIPSEAPAVAVQVDAPAASSVPAEPVQEAIAESALEASAEVSEVGVPTAQETAEVAATDAVSNGEPEEEPQLVVAQTVSVVVQNTVETFTETLTVTDTSTETTDAGIALEESEDPAGDSAAVVDQPALEAPEQDADTLPLEAAAPVEETPLAATEAEAPVENPLASADVVSTAPDVQPELAEADIPSAVLDIPASAEAESSAPASTDAPAIDAVAAPEPQAVEAVETQTDETVAETVANSEPVAVAEAPAETESSGAGATDHVAYEEYLKDNNEPVNIFQAEAPAESPAPEDLAAAQEPVTKIDPSGDVQIEMDTKNAHVWNELGNVYFNTGAYDDAIIAYSKAIELDRWFAWPYSNLALAYVQKARFAEAILLYQRSIELFTGDKDKAISWNRLGNVYRRMNDYDNAICAYQRADELDPDNTTLSLQSRFSLLGSYAIEEKPSYVS